MKVLLTLSTFMLWLLNLKDAAKILSIGSKRKIDFGKQGFTLLSGMCGKKCLCLITNSLEHWIMISTKKKLFIQYIYCKSHIPEDMNRINCGAVTLAQKILFSNQVLRISRISLQL